jgi:hypothetical protein
MALNFNVDPYYDDFDPSKNFHRILFKPGYAVQARELTQAQTILQNQISNFADNIFTQNTPVSGGKVTTNLNCYYIKLNTQYQGVNITAASFANKFIQNSTGTIVAKVLKTIETTTVGTVVGDPPTLIVSILSGSVFSDNDTIYCTDDSTLHATVALSTTNSPSTGLASVASISGGIFYIINGYSQSSTPNQDGSFTKYSIGNFVAVQPQTAVLDKYDNVPNLRVGLQITETIYDYVNDSSLLDPAVGASNYQSPGADRYVIKLELITLPLTLGNDDGFIELLRIQNGSVVKQVDGTVYSTIDDYFAKRDYETNGDYIVSDFKITPNTNSSGDSTKYDLNIGPGVAYVHGYRVENQSNIVLTSDRARATQTLSANAVYIDYGSYFYVDTSNGTFDVTSMPSVDLHCVEAANIISTNTNTYSSTLVGTALIRNLTYVSSGTNSNTKSYVYKAYVANVSTNILSSNAIGASSGASTIAFYDTNGKFSSAANAYYGATLSITSGTSAGDVRKIVSYNQSTKVATVDNPFTITPDNTSNVSINFNTDVIESIVQVNGSYGLTANVNINTNNGKYPTVSIGATQLNNQAYPEMLFKLTQASFVSSLTSTNYVSTRIYRNKTFSGNLLTIDAHSGQGTAVPISFQGTGTLSGDTVKQLFTVIDRNTGRILDFASSGNTVYVTSANSVTFTGNTTSGVYSGKNVDVIAQVLVTNGNDYTYSLKSKNLIIGNTTVATAQTIGTVVNTNTLVDTAHGQVYILNAGVSSTSKMSLYVNDVKKIKKIIDTKSPSTVVTGAMLTTSTNDITNYFSFDNGQRDSFYDHASISLLPGAPIPQGNILVIFDYYSHSSESSGDGYFSVQSYLNSAKPEKYAEIGNYTSSHGTYYRLTDSIDFRPCRKNAQSSYVWEYQGGLGSTGSFNGDDGILIPWNLTDFYGTYSYYLARKDKLILTKDKQFKIIEGTPSLVPSFPTEPNGALVIANLSLDPYTAYIPGEGPPGITSNLSINKVIHKRWAKSDITDLENRVNNLEYYTSLSLLEQAAQAAQVPDVNGLNRFKNGILVDDFSSYSTADTKNPDFASKIDIGKNKLGPVTLVNNFQLQNPIVLASLATAKKLNTYRINSIHGGTTNLFTLPYTTSNVIVQPLASSAISINPFNVVVQEGVEKLTPPMDNWVDNNQAPAILITDPSLQAYQQSNGLNYTNMGAWQTIPGTLYSTSTSTTSGRTMTTVTNIYGSQQQNITASGYTSLPAGTITNNGYLTSISILPYIRPQQIIVKSKGLLINSKLDCWFDGVNVNQYMDTPNTIELTNVNNANGGFKEDDIVGFYVASAGVFYPIARVVSVYNYPNSTSCRLYVSNIVGAPITAGSVMLSNATFDSNGNYQASGNTAQGTLVDSAVISLNQNDTLGGVGGGYSNTLNSGVTTQYYISQPTAGWCDFLNQYGIWGDQDNSGSYSAAFPVTFSKTDTYTLISSCDDYATVYIDGTAQLSVPGFGTTYSASLSISAGSHTVSWNATNVGGPAGFALVIKDSSGNIVFDTIHPLYYTSAASTGSGISTEIVLPLGGAWFTGVTTIKLGASASSIANFYVGSKINITSKYIYQVNQASTYVPPPPAPSGGGGGGGGKIICKKLAELGYFDKEMNDADQRFGALLRDSDSFAYNGYLRWAQTVVDLMEGKGSEGLRKFIFFWQKDKDRRIEMQKNIVIYYMDMLARPWAEEMAFRMKAKGYEKSNPTGRLLMSIGLPLCRKVGKIQSNKDLPLFVKILAIWGTVTVLLVLVFAISGTNAIFNKVKSWFKKKPQVSKINN